MNEKIHRIMKSKKKKKKKKSACISVHRIGLMLLCGHTPTIYRVNGQGTRKEGRKEQGYAIHLVIFAHRALRTKQTYKRKGMENEFYSLISNFFLRAHRDQGSSSGCVLAGA